MATHAQVEPDPASPPLRPADLSAARVTFRLTFESTGEDLQSLAAKVMDLARALTREETLCQLRTESGDDSGEGPDRASLVIEGSRSALLTLRNLQKDGQLEAPLALKITALGLEGAPITLCQVLELELSQVDLKGLPEAELWRRSASLGPLDPDEEAGRLRRVFDAVHARGRRAALCLSGGGIRSATFSLGVLQGLASRGWLPRFDFLSTVSGGGYIGGWFTAWLQRVGGDLSRLEAELARKGSGSGAELEPEAHSIRHLRAFSNYLSPRLGVLSPDVWTLAAIYLRNLLINLAVLIPWLCAVLMLPRLCLLLVNAGVWDNAEEYGPRVLLVSALLALFGAMLAVQEIYARSEVEAGARAMVPNHERFLGWVGLGAVGITVYLPWYQFVTGKPLFWGAIILTTVLVAASALGHYWWYGRGLLRRISILRKNRESGRRADPQRGRGSEADATMSRGEGPTAAPAGPAGSGGMAAPAGPAGSGPTAGAWRGQLCALLSALSSAAPLLITILVAGALATGLLWLFEPKPGTEMKYLLPYVCFTPPALLFALFLGMTAASMTWSSFLDQVDLEWAARLGARVLLLAGTSLVVNSAILYGPVLLYRASQDWVGNAIAAAGGVSGVLVWAARQVLASRSAARSPGESSSGLVVALGTAIGAPLLSMLILMTLSLGLSQLLSEDPWKWRNPSEVATAATPETAGAVFLGVVAVAALASFLARVNKFSLHSMYRDRLVAAYLGASHEHRDRRPSTFDYDDDLRLGELSELRPFHVVNATLNVMQRSATAWQQSKSESFTFSRLHCGSSYLVDTGSSLKAGYRGAAGYAGSVTLGTAIALSGAAASPNMGDYSSTAFAFLMSLFNVRLGAWLGNPRFQNTRWIDLKLSRLLRPAWRRNGPAMGAYYLVRETLSRADENSKFLYISDGGHFENLGLYEMVLRRCQLLVVVDAGCDPGRSFGDLGNAVRKIRIKLGIAIEFEKLEQLETGGYAEAVIDYSMVDGAQARKGRLIYLKPGLVGDEPVDVRNYARQVSAFPHETTADQFFSEAQFESYRTLGLATVERLPVDLLDGAGFDGTCGDSR